MNKVLVYSNAHKESLKVKEDLIDLLAKASIKVITDKEVPDYIITIGGDGTFLQAFHRYYHFLNTSHFIGIHTGHLGFYTDWLADDLEQVVTCVTQPSIQTHSYPLLETLITYNNGTQRKMLALNEMTVRSNSGTMVCDVSIKDYLFETFRGDGLCVATPTGSTGLSKSLGGAVLSPQLNALQLTEMASINNRVYRTLGSPLIITEDEWIELIPQNKLWIDLAIDNISWQDVELAKIQCRIADERLHLANFKQIEFWDRVENSFIGVNRNELR